MHFKEGIKGELEMFMLLILTLLFGLSMIGIISFRLFIEHRLRVLQGDVKHPRSFKKKLAQLTRKERLQHIHFLIFLLITGSFSFGLLGLISFTTQSNYQAVKRESDQIIGQIENLKKVSRQTAMTSENHLLEEKEWGKLFKESQDNDRKSEIERSLSQQAMRYFDISEVAISIDEVNKAVAIQLTGQVETHEKKEKLKRQIRGFVQSVDESLGLTQIRIQLTTRIGEDDCVVYRADYVRSNEKELFKKVNDFERDVKLGGEKG